MRSGESGNWGDDTFAGDSSPNSVILTMRQGPRPGQRFTIRKANVTIGRLPVNDIAISDQQISRHHATISWENDQFLIRDLGSANGTTVNGIPISAPCPLRDGDVIGLGDIVLTFQAAGAGLASTPARSPAQRSGYSGTAGRGEPYPLRSPRVRPLSGTMEMGSTAVGRQRSSGGSSIIWPILIGVSLAIFLALIFAAAIIVLVLNQTQSVPKIALQQPLNGVQTKVGDPVLILASASDQKGISRVEIWVNGVLNANITSSSPSGQTVLPVQYPWTPVTGGIHNISLKAYNVSGSVSEPANVSIAVADIPPPPTPQQPQQQTSASPTAIPLVLATPAPTNTPLVLFTPTTAPQSCVNDAAFVADVTVPDNTILQPGARIDKTWRIRNSGTCPWGTGYRLVFSSGNKMGAPDSQPVVPTAPGGTTDVTVTMYAPSEYGVHTGVWRMVNPNGEGFGGRFTVVIQIPSPHTPTPDVTPTFTPLPGPEITIWVDPDHINAGECTTVRAKVEGVKAAWLDETPIAGGYIEKQDCPCEDTRYVLRVDMPGGARIEKDATVQVEGTCVVAKPDLRIRNLEILDGEPIVGSEIEIRIRIVNEGTKTAKNFVLSWQPKGEGSGKSIEETIERLDPGESRDFRPFATYTYDEKGTYESFAKVDYTNKIDEIDEDNNTKTLKIKVKEP